MLCISLATNIAMAQVTYKASVVPSQINKDEYATLRLEIDNGSNIQSLQPPVLKDFIVLSGPNQETGMSTINGVSKVYMAVSYILQPKRAGKFTIGESAVVVAGKKYTSVPIHLTVKNEVGKTRSGQAATPFTNPFIDPTAPEAAPVEQYTDYILKKGESVPEKVSRNMQLRLQTNKTSCYIGEPVVATYKLYTRLKSESKMTKAPSFNGFSVIDLMRPDESEQTRERLNGREYNVYTVRKSQLYPLQDGDIELESATLDNRVQFVKEDAKSSSVDGFLNGFSVNPDAIIDQSVSLSSKPFTIHVKPLPETGKPASFNGAVGKFEISAVLEKNEIGSDESGKLLVTVAGSGNLQMITAPEVKWPAGMESFDAKVEEEFDNSTVPLTGSKVFAIPFTVNNTGEYKIPVIHFSYFDPATGTYKTDSTKPIAFSVIKGSTKPVYDLDTLSQKAPASISKQIFSHREWIVGVIALLIILGLFTWNRLEHSARKKQLAANKQKQQETVEVLQEVQLQTVAEQPQNPLHKTEECLNSTDCSEFYPLLNAEFKGWLSARFDLNVQEVNAKKIISALDKAGIENGTALQVQQLMQDIEWQLYTPFERDDTMNEMYSRAQQVLQTIKGHQPVVTL